MNHRVFLSIGSNLGNRLEFLQRGVDMLGAIEGVSIAAVSSVYETEPVGNKNQPPYLNAALELRCSLAPDELVAQLKAAERTIGRSSSERWGPREIDLDLVYYADVVTVAPGLAVPHPEAERRKFVLVPIAELSPTFIDPKRQRTVGDLLRDCTDTSAVDKIASKLQPPAPER